MSRRARTIDQEPVMHGASGWWWTHGVPSVFPLLAAVVWAVAIQGAHMAWGGNPFVTPLVAIVLFVLGGALTAFGVTAAGPRKHLRAAVAVTGTLATLNLLLGLVFGMGHGWLISVYVVCALADWVLWLTWRWSKYGGATQAGDGTGMNALLEMAKDARVRVSAPRVDERGVVRAKVATLPGGTIEDAQALVGPVSAATRAVPGGTSLIGNPDVDGIGEIEIATRDNLKHPIPWPGLVPELRGIMPTSWFSLGEYQTGPVRVRIVGDVDQDRSAPDVSHLKIGGVTGSGKSTGAQVLLGSLMGMRKTTLIGVDVSAELQILGPLAEGFTIAPITDYEHAKLFIHRMTKVVIPGRKAHLAREGLKRWSPRSSLNLMVVVFEESKAFGRLSAAYHAMVSDARAAGVWIISSTQSWLWRNLSTDVRKQHPSGWCFGMSEADDVGTVLPEEALAALGNNLPTWADKKPGYSYLAGIGAPQRAWSKMMRAYDPLREQLVEAVRLGAPYRDEMDGVTAELLGDQFPQQRFGPVPAAVGRPVARIVPKRTHDIGNHFHDGVGDADEEEAEAAEDYEAERREDLAELDEQRRQDLGEHATTNDLEDVDPGRPIDDMGADDDEAHDAEVELTPQQAQRVWDERLHELWQSGERHLTTGRLAEWLAEVGRARPFLYRQRDRWADMGCIEPRDDGDGWDLIASPLERWQSPPHGE